MKLRNFRDLRDFALQINTCSLVLPENTLVHVELETPLFEKFILDKTIEKAMIDLNNMILTTKGIRFFLTRTDYESELT